MQCEFQCEDCLEIKDKGVCEECHKSQMEWAHPKQVFFVVEWSDVGGVVQDKIKKGRRLVNVWNLGDKLIGVLMEEDAS